MPCASGELCPFPTVAQRSSPMPAGRYGTLAMATSIALLPTPRVASTVLVAASITDTVLERRFVT